MVKSDSNEKDSISVGELDEFLSDLEMPIAVAEAKKETVSSSTGFQNEIAEFDKEQKPRVHLFFSFDIVNSTMYKAFTGNWPIIIRGLLDGIRDRVYKTNDLEACFLWRVIGDEMVFVLPIQNKNELLPAIDAIFEVTQRISISLKNGKFFDTLENQNLQKRELDMLKTQNPLSIKSAAWIAVINDSFDSPYDNVSFISAASSQNQIIKEYLGKDIDAGFRLKGYTQDRRLAISFELAYLILDKCNNKNLHIMDYVRLKGVWNESLYPIIWYYNSDTVGKLYSNSVDYENANQSSFEHSFRYDETDNNPLVKKYFSIRNILKNRSQGTNRVIDPSGLELSVGMYSNIEHALNKILRDRNLQSKFQYIDSLLEDNDLRMKSMSPYVHPLEMHCAVVCCDVNERKIFVIHRGSEHNTNPGKWEFGCAKATSEKSLVSGIQEYYKTTYAMDVELVLDDSRIEKQPLPIAVYEINHTGNIKKGIIFVAKTKNPISPDVFRPDGSHDKIRWITEDDLKDFSEKDTVSDFHHTIKTVFHRFDELFSK
ncbi:MAG: hypothetical protein MR966_08105 [Lachnospiraceae bacterium]|nr:hypothetical protein [Lachnospiraceae bacterium]